MKTKILVTLFLIALFGILHTGLVTYVELKTGEFSTNQLSSSTDAFVQSQLFDKLGHLLSPSLWVGLVVVLYAIWSTELKKALGLLSLVILCSFASPHDTHAYWNDQDIIDPVIIHSNQTAIEIPAVGDVMDGQSQYNSVDYFDKHKVPTQLYFVPHMKLERSTGRWSYDKFVPKKRLILVDRTPYGAKWTSSNSTGTSSDDQGLKCQSSEGLTVNVGISIAAEIAEKDASKFLYRFGTINQPGEQSSPEVIYASVLYGRPVSDVMDKVVYIEVQSLVCDEISKRKLDDVNDQANQYKDIIHAKLATYMSNLGLTLTTFGWADTFTFDPAIQKAINDRYIAQTLGTYAPTLNALAMINVQEGMSTGLANHGLPMVSSPDLFGNLLAMPVLRGATTALVKTNK